MNFFPSWKSFKTLRVNKPFIFIIIAKKCKYSDFSIKKIVQLLKLSS